MSNLKNLFAITPVAAAVSLAAATAFAPMSAQAEWSGNIGVHSKYLLRGIFDENDSTAIQGGVDYSEGMFYAGWWFSNLGYNYDKSLVAGADGLLNTADDASGVTDAEGFENDFYLGMAGETAGGLAWDVGLIQYVYMDVDDSDLTELTASLGMAGFSVGMQYLLSDGWWGNQGDIYWKLGYNTDLPSDFNLDVMLGYYTYDDSDNSDLCFPAGSSCGATTEDSGYRHLNLTVSHPVGSTGADAYVQFTHAGEDRGGNDYENSVVAGITYGFDL